MITRIKKALQRRAVRALGLAEYEHLQRTVVELNDLGELKKAFGWQLDPVLDDPQIHEWNYVEDANQRRIRDAESIGVIARNINPKICLEIGTASGHGTALIAVNAPQSTVYTVNAPPEDILGGQAGNLTTMALEREKVGEYYRERGLQNIQQIFANTATWSPAFGPIDLAFIDGCHDTDFVHNDTRKCLKQMKPGGYILWHDFNPSLVDRYHWIGDVCRGVERLLADNIIQGPIFHIRDSWVGVNRVAAK